MKVAAIFSLAMAFVGGIITAMNVVNGNSLTDGLALTITFAILAVFFYARSKRKAKRKQRCIEEQERKASQGIESEMRCKLVDGLPLASDTVCTVALTHDGLSITGAEQVFKVSLSQIIAAQSKSDFEILQEVTSSMGKAVVGGFLFGAVGAVVGSRPKTKKTTVTSHFLIVNYTNQSGETAVLSFEGFSRKDCDILAAGVTAKVREIRGDVVTSL